MYSPRTKTSSIRGFNPPNRQHKPSVKLHIRQKRYTVVYFKMYLYLHCTCTSLQKKKVRIRLSNRHLLVTMLLFYCSGPLDFKLCCTVWDAWTKMRLTALLYTAAMRLWGTISGRLTISTSTSLVQLLIIIRRRQIKFIHEQLHVNL